MLMVTAVYLEKHIHWNIYKKYTKKVIGEVMVVY